MPSSAPGRAHYSSSSSRRKWDEPIPPILRPIFRAYVLGYASSVGPRVVTLVLQHTARWRRALDPDYDAANTAAPPPPPQPNEPFLRSLRWILQGGLDLRRFPAFCTVLIGGTTLLELTCWASAYCGYVCPHCSVRYQKSLFGDSLIFPSRLSRWFASFTAAWFSLRLLQSKHSDAYTEVTTVRDTASKSGGPRQKVTRYAGRTLDLTLFAACRAVDVVVGELWAQRRERRTAAGKWTWLDRLAGRLADPAVFAASSAVVMWAWIYHPGRLPRAYRRWIGRAADVDPRLVEALRRLRRGELRYGHPEGAGAGAEPLLRSLCADRGWPARWGDPALAAPFPCELVHAGLGGGASCERHALARFAAALRWSAATHLPLGLAAVLVGRGRGRERDRRALAAALAGAARSSAFLAAFVALFYYGVCLARTRVGPRVLGGRTTTTTAAAAAAVAQRLDGGVCVAAGCLLCGWSILLEGRARAANTALFVAPRALAALLPRRYPRRAQWRETLAFALAAAAVLTAARENPARVRGVLGKVLRAVLEP